LRNLHLFESFTLHVRGRRWGLHSINLLVSFQHCIFYHAFFFSSCSVRFLASSPFFCRLRSMPSFQPKCNREQGITEHCPGDQDAKIQSQPIFRSEYQRAGSFDDMIHKPSESWQSENTTEGRDPTCKSWRGSHLERNPWWHSTWPRKPGNIESKVVLLLVL
jgi:hypothetical protein